VSNGQLYKAHDWSEKTPHFRRAVAKGDSPLEEVVDEDLAEVAKPEPPAWRRRHRHRRRARMAVDGRARVPFRQAEPPHGIAVGHQRELSHRLPVVRRALDRARVSLVAMFIGGLIQASRRQRGRLSGLGKCSIAPIVHFG
jgi:hypothetical protein